MGDKSKQSLERPGMFLIDKFTTALRLRLAPRAGAKGVFFEFSPKFPDYKTNRWITIEDIDFPTQTGAIVRRKDSPFEDIKTGPIKVEER